MEYFNKILCVTSQELTEGSNPVFNAGTLNVYASKGKIVRVHRYGGEGGYVIYAWSSLPKKYKERYMERYGDPEELMKAAMTENRVCLDGEARSWYENFCYEKNGQEEHLTEKLIEEYTINASVLKELLRLMAQRRALRQDNRGIRTASDSTETLPCACLYRHTTLRGGEQTCHREWLEATKEP